MEIDSGGLDVATKREKITFTCEKELRATLEQMAEEEGRTLSNLVERIILESLKKSAAK